MSAETTAQQVEMVTELHPGILCFATRPGAAPWPSASPIENQHDLVFEQEKRADRTGGNPRDVHCVRTDRRNQFSPGGVRYRSPCGRPATASEGIENGINSYTRFDGLG